MDLKSLFVSIHGRIQAKEGKKISHKEMSERIHCSKSTYDKYHSGELNPKAINNLMCLLTMLDKDDLQKTIEIWKKNCEQKG